MSMPTSECLSLLNGLKNLENLKNLDDLKRIITQLERPISFYDINTVYVIGGKYDMQTATKIWQLSSGGKWKEMLPGKPFNTVKNRKGLVIIDLGIAESEASMLVSDIVNNEKPVKPDDMITDIQHALGLSGEVGSFAAECLKNSFDPGDGSLDPAVFGSVWEMIGRSRVTTFIKELQQSTVYDTTKDGLTGATGKTVSYDHNGRAVTAGGKIVYIYNGEGEKVGLIESVFELRNGREDIHLTSEIYWEEFNDSMESNTLSKSAEFLMGLMIWIYMMSHLTVNRLFVIGTSDKASLLGMFVDLTENAMVDNGVKDSTCFRTLLHGLNKFGLYPIIPEVLKIRSDEEMTNHITIIEQELKNVKDILKNRQNGILAKVIQDLSYKTGKCGHLRTFTEKKTEGTLTVGVDVNMNIACYTEATAVHAALTGSDVTIDSTCIHVITDKEFECKHNTP
jgi:hypothetical protein